MSLFKKKIDGGIKAGREGASEGRRKERREDER